MVQIIIKKIQGMEEWTVVELQGELVSRYDNGMAGNVVGDLHLTKSGEPVLIIGHHILHGKVSELDKPYGVMVEAQSKETTEDEYDDVAKTYHIQAIIRKKIVFKNRPKPIITHVAKRI